MTITELVEGQPGGEAHQLGREVKLGEMETYGGVEIPAHLITMGIFKRKMGMIRDLMGGAAEANRPGSSYVAGDGQYGEELQWYKEQMRNGHRKDIRFRDLGEGLDQAVIVRDFDAVRAMVTSRGGTPTQRVCITSRVEVFFLDEGESQVVVIVPPLERDVENGRIPLSAPLARAIESKQAGDVVVFKVPQRPDTTIKILSIE